jgi:hypothetical protein
MEDQNATTGAVNFFKPVKMESDTFKERVK